MARPPVLWALLGGVLCRGGVGCDGLVDLEIGHLELAREVEKQSVFLGREITFGFFMESVEHVDELASGFGIDDGLPGAWVGVSAEDHGGVAAEHTDEILEGSGALGRIAGSLARWSRRGRCRLRRSHSLASRFASFCLKRFLAQFTVGGEGAAVNYLETFVVLLVGHSNPRRLVQ